MTFLRGLPAWLWWLIGLAVIAAAGIMFFVRTGGSSLPPGLVEKRTEVAAILDEASRIEDVDLKPLAVLETKKDFKAAAALMDEAIAVNERQERLNASLLAASEELTRLAVGIVPDAIGTKAVEAFNALKQLAQTERDFLSSRRSLYEITRNYYADLAGKKKPGVPANFKSMVEAVNAQFDKVKDLYRSFTDAVRSFDEALRAR